jgi:hypothetical protein
MLQYINEGEFRSMTVQVTTDMQGDAVYFAIEMHCMTATLLIILRNMEGGKFNRYFIRAKLGRRRRAVVWRAYDPEFRREVALKILRQDLLDDTEVRERFEREIGLIANL